MKMESKINMKHELLTKYSYIYFSGKNLRVFQQQQKKGLENL